MATAFAGRGQRLDGGNVREATRTSSWRALTLVTALAVAIATVPSHDSFEEYLAATSRHPGNPLGSLRAFAKRLHIAVAAETRSLVILRTGTSPEGLRFIGAFRSWVWVPVPSFPTVRLLPDGCVDAVCSSEGGAPWAFALACLVGFALVHVAPAWCARHAHCSLRTLRAGRVWAALLSNCVHYQALHLLHNLLQVAHFGPIVQSSLGCESTLWLLCAAGLASSAASAAWHGLARGRPSEVSIGGSGVAMGLVAANAALYPRTRVHLYGMELAAPQAMLLMLVLDGLAASGGRLGEIDASSHIGGAAAGWMLAQRWSPWWAWRPW